MLFIICTVSQRSKQEELPPRAGTQEYGATLWWIWLIVKADLHCWAPNWQPPVLNSARLTRELFKVALHWFDRSLCSENIKTYAQVTNIIHCILWLWQKWAQRFEWIYRTEVQLCCLLFPRKRWCLAIPLRHVLYCPLLANTFLSNECWGKPSGGNTVIISTFH